MRDPIVGSGIAFSAQSYEVSIPANSGPEVLLASAELMINPRHFSMGGLEGAHASIVIDDGGHSLQLFSHVIPYTYEVFLDSELAAPFSTSNTLRILFGSRQDVTCEQGENKYNIVSFEVHLSSQILTLGMYRWKLTANYQVGEMSATATSELNMVITEGM